MTAKKALVVIDVQPVFMKDPQMLTVNGDDLVEKCKGLIDRARAGGVPVVYVQHIDKDDMPEGTPEADIAFHPDLAPQVGEPVVGKAFGSGFIRTNLDETLKNHRIQHLLVCGLSAYGCVNQTVLYAKLYGYGVTVVQDAVAAPEYEQFHTTEGIPVFLDAWERGGIRLASSQDAVF
ncbi:cysteine hydrolase family protein [Candidatus Bipolaricaulota bacterium]